MMMKLPRNLGKTTYKNRDGDVRVVVAFASRIIITITNITTTTTTTTTTTITTTTTTASITASITTSTTTAISTTTATTSITTKLPILLLLLLLLLLRNCYLPNSDTAAVSGASSQERIRSVCHP